MTDIRKNFEVRELRVEKGKEGGRKKSKLSVLTFVSIFLNAKTEWMNGWMDEVLPPDDLVCKPLRNFFQLWFLNEYLQHDKFYLYIWMTHVVNFCNMVKCAHFYEWNTIRHVMARRRVISRHNVKSNRDDFIMGNLCLYKQTHTHYLHSFPD